MSKKRPIEEISDQSKRLRKEGSRAEPQFRSQMEVAVRDDDSEVSISGRQLTPADLISQLTHLGEQISSVADRERDPNVKNNYDQVLGEITTALNTAFIQQQGRVARIQETRMAEESKGMGEEEMLVTQTLVNNFQRDITRVSDLLSGPASTMTYGEQARLYRDILGLLRERLDVSENIRQIENEPNQLDRLSQLVTAIYTFSLEQLAVTQNNLYECGPQLARQTAAILTSSMMLYNYQPEIVRRQFENIPYFGVLFQVMNRSNGILRILTNSGGTLTTIYYLLRNAGLEQFTDRVIDGTKQMAIDLGRMCQRQGSLLVCRTGEAISNSASQLMGLLADRLGDMVTGPFRNIEVNIEGSQPSSASSVVSQQSVHELLTTPIQEGGISINQNDNQVEQQIINERFTELVSGEGEIVQGEPENLQSSQSTDVSEMTVDSQDSTVDWKYPSASSGGRRLRKSRRHMRLLKTRRGKRRGKGRGRGRVTRKGKRNYRTMKRNRQKMRK